MSYLNTHKIVVDNVIPIICPKFLTKELMLPAIPSLFLGTVDIINELLAESS